MVYTDLLIVNKSLGKIGGASDRTDGSAFLPNLTDLNDKTTIHANALLPQVRQHVIIDLANARCPFRETLKYADLGDDLKQNDNTIVSITVGADPFLVTVTTEEAHGYTTGDTVMLFDIQGTGGITSLNNKLYTIAVTTTTAFTLTSCGGVTTAGEADWVHTADTGISSDAPEIGDWLYCFDLPSECIAVVKMCDETDKKREYQYEVILDKDSNSKVLLTNDLSNASGDSAFIQYCIDQSNPALLSDAMVEAFSTLLAAELCPICGRDIKTRQQMLLEYQQLSKPDAQTHNQSQFNNVAKTVNNFLGGRS